MTPLRVYALGEDPYWLKAVAGIADDMVHVHTFFCKSGLAECTKRLPRPTLAP